jgi:hypothetical protein
MSDDLRGTRVFISCGQAKGTDEVTIAQAIAERLRRLGFEPYIAVQEQTLRGLKENIFEQLEQSEYYLFVDFKREALEKTDPPVCRGSLFSHQELALASYLDIPLIALQESGVRQDDGILRFLQANALLFSERRLLPETIASEVQKRNWDPRWRNELVLEREPGQFSDAQRVFPSGQSAGMARFFHVNVRNRHRRNTARNCYVYLERMVNLTTSAEIPLKAVEFKWAGYLLPNAHIPAGQVRKFDAFWVFNSSPADVLFNVFADSNEYIPRIPTAVGRYELTYLVVADDFPPARGSFILSLQNSLGLTTFEST